MLKTKQNFFLILNRHILKCVTGIFVADSSIVKDTAAFGNLQSAEMTSALTGSLHYLVKKDEPALRPMTSFIVADLETPKGREIIYDAIKFLVCNVNMFANSFTSCLSISLTL